MMRERRKWTDEEDALLRKAVTRAQEDGRPLIWHEIAAFIPGRTNKDCRKRWYGITAATVNKGAWTALEDKKLYNAVKRYGTKWSIVASAVGTRTGDQCSKRWSNTINPEIDHSEWTPKEDELLLDGVNQYGRNWQQIISIHFPRRTSLAAKNRYHLLRRKSEGARTYTKSKTRKISVTELATADDLDGSLGMSQWPTSSSENDMDEDLFEGDDAMSYISAQNRTTSPEHSLVFPFGATELDMHSLSSTTSETDCNMSDTRRRRTDYSIGNAGSYGTEPHDLPMQCPPPFSNLCFSNYASSSQNPGIQQPSMQPSGIPLLPPSSSNGDASNTRNIEDFSRGFLPNTKPPISLEDQTMFDTDALFEYEPELMFGMSHHPPPHTSAEPLSVPNIISSSGPNSTCFSTSTAGPSTPSDIDNLSSISSAGSWSPSSTNLTISSQENSRGGGGSGGQQQDTRRITIEVVSSRDELSRIIQAVADLSVSAVFKIYE